MLLFGSPHIIILTELKERSGKLWNICLARKLQRSGVFQNAGYRSYARKTAYRAFQKSGICGLFPKTRKSPLTDGEKKIKKYKK